MVRRSVWYMIMPLVAAGFGSLSSGGCATGNSRRDQLIAETGGRPAEATPQKGWSNYRPDRRLYEPDPARAAATPTPSSRPDVTGQME
jgi:hypothetical protein